MKLPKQTWQERFDKEFPNARNIFQNGDPNDIKRKSIKSFIAKILKEEISSAVQAEKTVYRLLLKNM